MTKSFCLLSQAFITHVRPLIRKDDHRKDDERKVFCAKEEKVQIKPSYVKRGMREVIQDMKASHISKAIKKTWEKSSTYKFKLTLLSFIPLSLYR